MVTVGTYRRYARLSERSDHHNDLKWLSVEEERELAHWRHPIRQQAWLDGRWTCKNLIRECLDNSNEIPEFTEISILSLDEKGRAVRPQIRLAGQARPWTLSITHSDRAILVAFSMDPNRKLGVDLCQQQCLTDRFIQTWFTSDEQKQLNQHSPLNVCRAWAAKESIYKAINRGESFAPRRIEVFWNNNTVTCRYDHYVFGDELQLESWMIDNHVAVSAEIAGPPPNKKQVN